MPLAEARLLECQTLKDIVTLAEQNPRHFAWLLTGVIVGHGPDCEPLRVDTMAIASVSRRALDEAAEHYHHVFDAGRGPED